MGLAGELKAKAEVTTAVRYCCSDGYWAVCVWPCLTASLNWHGMSRRNTFMFFVSVFLSFFVFGFCAKQVLVCMWRGKWKARKITVAYLEIRTWNFEIVVD